VAALHSLAQEGALPASTVADAIGKYGLDPDKPDPTRA
jgi:pyruvate dehydrogenase E1 component